MKGYEFDPEAREFRWHYGDRVVMSSSGKLVELLPAAFDFVDTVSFSYPDASKAAAEFRQRHVRNEIVGGVFRYNRGAACKAYVGAQPQEWEASEALASAPEGADFVVGVMRLRRTVAPSHQWAGVTIATHPELEAYIPIGSHLLESCVFGLVRAMSLIVEDAELILHQQQSVSVPPGGWGARSATTNAGRDREASEWRVVSGVESIPVYSATGSPWEAFASDSLPDQDPPPPAHINYPSCSAPDPTDYGSTWEADIIAMFGSHERLVSAP